MSEHRLTPILDLETLSPDEAFAILGDENRLEIVRALWSANAMRLYDDVDESEAAIRYSELRTLTSIDDKGKLYSLNLCLAGLPRRRSLGRRRLSSASLPRARA